ncbi:MAG: hypothetical protein ACE5PV_13090, partial [Candidatus Poribacteria bacterium]
SDAEENSTPTDRAQLRESLQFHEAYLSQFALTTEERNSLRNSYEGHLLATLAAKTMRASGTVPKRPAWMERLLAESNLNLTQAGG